MIYDFLVIGGGISGISAGYELAAKGSVLMLEAESALGYHSTGRSAALFTPHYGGEVVRRINLASQSHFLTPPTGFCDAPLVSRRGAVSVASPGHGAKLAASIDRSSPGNEVFAIAAHEALERAPFLREDRVEVALYEPNVQDIDVHGLHQAYLRGLKTRAGVVMTGEPVRQLQHGPNGWCATTPNATYEARIVINAAGAWAGLLGEMAGALDIGLVAKRRTVIVIDAPEGLDVTALPAVDFIETGAYIKPEAGRLMASPGDATPTEPQDAQPEELDVAILADWIETETTLKVRRIAHKWAGLRSFVRDDAPVVGFDARAAGFFWLAGQGGYGIMMAPALARFAAALCVGDAASARQATDGVTARDLAPDRPALVAQLA